MNRDLELALVLAEQADGLSMRYFRSSSLEVRTKSDRTPVSEADEAIERMIRAQLAAECPDDGIVGEEFGAAGDASRRWILDPIDATKNYIRGIPIFATLIALEEAGRITVGVVSAPALRRRWWATAGRGAYCNGERIHVSRVSSLAEAQIGYDEIPGFEEHGLGRQFETLLRRSGRSRGFGDFWTHMLVAEGAIEVAIEPRVALWDLAPLQIIVEEAGGRFTNLAGKPGPDGGSAVSSNALLHDEVLELMR